MGKIINMYDEMALVVMKDMATGSFTKQLRDIDVQLVMEVMQVDSSPVDLSEDFDELMKGSKPSSSTMPFEKWSHKR